MLFPKPPSFRAPTALAAVAVPSIIDVRINNKNVTEATSTETTFATTATTTTLATRISALRDTVIRLCNSRLDSARLEKCTAVVGAAVVTFLLKLHLSSAVAASSWTALIAALTLRQAPTAALCGSFAGMSGHAATLPQAAQVGVSAAAIFYWWDQQAIGVGKGGRLGTIAFLGNLLYYSAVVRGGLGKLLGSTLEIFGSLTAVVLALSASALHFARTTPAAAAAADKFHDYRSGESIYPMTRDPNNLRRLAQASKMVILFAVAARLWTSTTVAITSTVVPSLLSMVLAALTVQNSAGVVLPVALVGLLGSIVTPALATSVYLGAFVGMTKLARFGLSNTVQACTLATLLLHLGVVDGFGGKLGVLSFLGVLFGM